MIAAGEFVSDNDFVVATLSGLSREYSITRTMINTKDITISLREFREQLLCAKREAESLVQGMTHNFARMYMQGSFGNPSSSGPSQGSSSNSEGMAFSTRGIITKVPNGSSSFNMPFL